MERRRPALIAGAAYSHCARCQGEFCDHIRLLDPSSDLLFGATAPFSASCSGSLASQDIARASEDRERAHRIIQGVLTKEEAGKLEESGDLIQLRIAERVDPFAYRTVSTKQVDAVKKEYRAGRAKLAITEKACLIPEEDWSNLIKAHASDTRRGQSIGPTPSKGEVLVCETCYHVYTLLEKARWILEGRAETGGGGGGGGGDSVGSAEGDIKPASSDTSLSNVKPKTKPTKKSKKKRRHRQPVEDSSTQRENAKPNVAAEAATDKKIVGGGSSSSLPATKPQSPQQKPLTQHPQYRYRGTKRPRLLVADGDKQTILTITRHFRANNYVIRTASNGEECLDILQTSSAPFDVLLLAKGLPTSDAIEITKWLRCRYSEEKEKRDQMEKACEKRRTKRKDSESLPLLPQILVMTSELTPLDLRSYVSIGIDGCIRKPLELKQLTKTVTDAVEYQAKRLDAEENGIAKKRIEAAEQAKAGAAGKKTNATKASESPAGKNDPPDAVLRLAPPAKKERSNFSSKAQKTPVPKAPLKRAENITTADNLNPNSFSGVFEVDAATSLPFAVLDSGYIDHSNPSATAHSSPPFFNLVVCHDAFDTLERMSILLSDLVVKYPGVRILLWNYPGQAFTSFADDAVLNNEYLALCLDKLLRHVGPEGSIRRFDSEMPFYLLGYGIGGSVASCFAAKSPPPGLRGLVLVNSLSHVDTHYASVIHDCTNVFGCAPETRPDLPVYFYSRFIFSKSYLVQTSAPLALNLYTAVHNPITIRGRLRLCLGMLANVDTRPLLGDISAPIISVHGDQDELIRPLHAKSYLEGRNASKTIHTALKGVGKRTCILMVKGGHELFQEKKKQMVGVIEQLLTGQYEGRDGSISSQAALGAYRQEDTLIALPTAQQDSLQLPKTPVLRFEDKFIDSVLDFTSSKGSDVRKRVGNITAKQRSGKNDTANSASPQTRPKILLDPTKPSFERQSNVVYKAGGNINIYPDPGQYPEVSEYMAWRLKRNRKRLLKLDNAARVLQGAFRVFVARTMLNHLKKERSALTIQRCYRGNQGRIHFCERRMELWAALFVQRVVRGHRGRCESYRQRLQRESQIRLAKRWRGTKARRLVLALIARRHLAATYMQCLWRRSKAKRTVAFHRERRYASIVLSRMYRGHLGRRRAEREREKYLFSRSQSSGIELGRQLLAEHKLHATRLQSEISLLDQDRRVAEERVDVLLEEIGQFEGDVEDLEKEMHALAKAERENAAVLKGNLKHKLRDQKIRLDKEFGVMLAKIADRKKELKDLEKKLQDLGITRQGKNEEMKSLERKLVVLLEAQEQQIEAIRRKRENRREVTSTSDARNTQRECGGGVDAGDTCGGSTESSAALSPYQGPTAQQKQEAADLMSSTEQLMKFGFMSMSMTYFSSLNMVRAMKVAVQDTALAGAAASTGGNVKSPGEIMSMPASPGAHSRSPTNATTKQVRNWSVEDVTKWLSAQSLDMYADSFREGAVDGNFLCKLTDDDLRGVLGVEHKLHRKKILCSIEELMSPLMPTSPLAISHPSAVEIASADAVSLPQTAVPSSPYSSPLTSANISTSADAALSAATTSMPPQGGLVPPTFEELATWVRNKKIDKLHEAIDILPTKPFDERDVRVQFVEDVGTAYAQSYEKQVYHLNKCDVHGNTIFHVAAQNGATKIAKQLIAKGANPNHQNKEGQTPGHFAIAYQFFDFASWLFDDSSNGGKASDGLTNIYGLGVYDGLGREGDDDGERRLNRGVGKLKGAE